MGKSYKGTREYVIWCDIKQMCYNKNNYNYHNYGELGINIYSKWKQNSNLFVEYIRNLPYYNIKKYNSIIRIDKNKNFEPDNLMWVNNNTKGIKKDKLYYLYFNIKNRCYNQNNHNYNRYGGRGIGMCDEWYRDINDFINYVKKLPFTNNFSLDRIDNNKNYEPGNVRWADNTTQAINKNIYNNNKSGYKGIYSLNNKYISKIGGKYLGRFNTKKEALEARNNYIIEHNLKEYKIQKYKGE